MSESLMLEALKAKQDDASLLLMDSERESALARRREIHSGNVLEFPSTETVREIFINDQPANKDQNAAIALAVMIVALTPCYCFFADRKK